MSIKDIKKDVKNIKEKLADLTQKEDLSIAVMNLISLEEHLAFTAMKTGKNEYLTIMESLRDLRKELLKKLVANKEGEMWCISKHLLAATMRMMEVGSKYIKDNEKEAAKLYKSAFDTYTLFWFLQKIGGENDERTGKQT